MPTETFTDEIKFRCERDLKRRLKRVVLEKHGKYAKHQAVARDVIRDWVNRHEQPTKAA